MPRIIRKPTHAGSWYEDNGEVLSPQQQLRPLPCDLQPKSTVQSPTLIDMVIADIFAAHNIHKPSLHSGTEALTRVRSLLVMQRPS
jgi:hypothetical protein